MSDSEWRNVMYVDDIPSHSGTKIPSTRNDNYSTVPSVAYVQRLEQSIIQANSRIKELETRLSKLEMLSRTTREAVRKNATVLENVSRDLDGKIDRVSE